MMQDDPLSDDRQEIEADLFVLESLRWNRKEFEDRLCRASASQDEAVIGMLRLKVAYQFAEFFYQLAARRITTIEQIEALIQAHNEYLAMLFKDKAKMKRLGLRPDRILDAIFTEDTRPRLLQNWRDRPGSLDQSNLSRLLVTVMSTETCRKLIVACQAAGFITREKTPYGTVVVASTGVMEQVFGQCLRDLRLRIARGE
jgi:hypothetical protein